MGSLRPLADPCNKVATQPKPCKSSTCCWTFRRRCAVGARRLYRRRRSTLPSRRSPLRPPQALPSRQNWRRIFCSKQCPIGAIASFTSTTVDAGTLPTCARSSSRRAGSRSRKANESGAPRRSSAGSWRRYRRCVPRGPPPVTCGRQISRAPARRARRLWRRYASPLRRACPPALLHNTRQASASKQWMEYGDLLRANPQ